MFRLFVATVSENVIFISPDIQVLCFFVVLQIGAAFSFEAEFGNFRRISVLYMVKVQFYVFSIVHRTGIRVLPIFLRGVALFGDQVLEVSRAVREKLLLSIYTLLFIVLYLACSAQFHRLINYLFRSFLFCFK